MWFMRVWVPLAVAVTASCLLLYALMQQSYQSEQYDPQIQVAEDVALRVGAGVKPVTFAIKDQADIAVSLSSWFAIYDAAGTPIVSTGLLRGEMPQPPQTAFSDLRARALEQPNGVAKAKESRMTWEPEADVRHAVVVVEAGDHFVVAGRSMREIDGHIWNMESLIGIGWVLTLLATLFAVWIGSHAQDFITFSRQQ